MVLGQIAAAVRAERLFVRYRRQGQPAVQLVAQLAQVEKRENRGGGAAFHVAGAAAVDAPVNELATPGVTRPALAVADREHVDMTVER